MKKISTILLALTLSLSASLGQTPVMTMTTSKPIGSTISFDLIAYLDNTPIQVDFGDGTLINKTIGILTTKISGTLVGSQTVKIYGAGIYYIDCSSNQLTTLDVTKNNALTLLLCNSNQLVSLDVTKNTALNDFRCNSNQLATLDVTKNTALTLLYCSNNQLTTLDVTKNIALISFVCCVNQLTTLDLTKNIALTSFGCCVNQLTTLDVTKNTVLAQFYCNSNQLTTLDVTKNTVLAQFDCNSNQLTNLDVTKNTALTDLNYSNNNLTALDVTKNTLLTNLDCSNNRLTFSTLPLKQATWTIFSYVPQKPISIPKALGTGFKLDLSNQLTINGNTTVYTWKTKSGTTLMQGTDYTITNGATVFIKNQADSVYCELTNATFPDFSSIDVLSTTNAKVLSQVPVMTMTTSKPIGSTISFALEANTVNTPIQVDFGDGTLVNKTITASTNIIGTLVGSKTVKIYGTGINFLNCAGNQLTALDVTQNADLVELWCDDNLLTTLNITWNAALRYLNCYDNQLTTLDVTQNKTLDSFNCYNNLLTALDVTRNNTLTSLDCSNNRLTFSTLPLKQTAWTTFLYAPQQSITIVKTLGAGVKLDLSSQLTVNGSTTVYIWKTKSGTTLLQGTDYTITNGETVFLKTQADSVYCEMTNATFPDFTGVNLLKTINTNLTLNTAIEDMQTSGLEIYTHDKTLYINVPCNAQCSVFDINGRLIICKSIYSGLNNLQLQHSGVYLLKITSNSNVVTQKVLIE